MVATPIFGLVAVGVGDDDKSSRVVVAWAHDSPSAGTHVDVKSPSLLVPVAAVSDEEVAVESPMNLVVMWLIATTATSNLAAKTPKWAANVVNALVR